MVGALHWGLGHATRCIPIIDALLAQGARVVLASDGAALALWREQYPQLTAVELPSYGIRYPSNSMVRNIARQLPQLVKAIRLEQQMLPQLLRQHTVQAVISDNRYGLYSAQLPTVFISHQLHLPLPVWLAPPLWNAWHQRLIRNFDVCWVPDRAGADNLAGKLAHPPPAGRVDYVGALSRFSPVQKLEKKWDILAVLSGPEPQRHYFEAALVEQLMELPYRSLVVRGRPSSEQRLQVGAQVYRQDFMPQVALQRAFGESRFVIARSGYSTLLDLAALGISRALLVPTPGQTEQEYLARRQAAQGRAVVQQQGRLDLAAGIKALNTLKTNSTSAFKTDELDQAVTALLEQL